MASILNKNTSTKKDSLAVEVNVKERYAEGAQEKQEALCCPVSYRADLLEILPQEIIEKDYGCGDPSRYVREGDVVLDLGSGGGKICYMAAKLVGDNGHVHGVDMTDNMLALARKYQAQMAEKIGGDRVTFHKGYIQNLAFDLEAAAEYVKTNALDSLAAVESYETWRTRHAKTAPLIANTSVSLVISNCVLNLVDRSERKQMLREIYRVLKPGGRVAISDIISDEHVPLALQNDPEFWTGCISGAFQEEEFLQAFVDEGFVDVAYDKWDESPWQVIEGIEFRSVTLVAQKPLRLSQQDVPTKALMYLGPHRKIEDDLGNVFSRGKRVLVSAAHYEHIKTSTVAEKFIGFDVVEDSLLSAEGVLDDKVCASTFVSKTSVKETKESGGKCCA